MKSLFQALLVAAGLATADAPAIIPVAAWPRVLNLSDKQIVNASVSDCVEVGYRLIPSKPLTPAGKQIKSEQFIQDPTNAVMAKYEIVYEDIPSPPPPPPPEVVTNIIIGKIAVSFAVNNGSFRGIRWLGAPVTNQ